MVLCFPGEQYWKVKNRPRSNLGKASGNEDEFAKELVEGSSERADSRLGEVDVEVQSKKLDREVGKPSKMRSQRERKKACYATRSRSCRAILGPPPPPPPSFHVLLR